MAEPSSSASKASSMVAGKSDAEVEDILDRMLTRLALCDDSKLEPLLSKLLPLCISSLSSHSVAVRNKVRQFPPLSLSIAISIYFSQFSNFSVSEIETANAEISISISISRNFCVDYANVIIWVRNLWLRVLSRWNLLLRVTLWTLGLEKEGG